MIFEENDIKFEELDDRQFEELCLDLLQKLGFHSHVWRQGGADSGRDIEAKYYVHNPLIGFYEERWFVECKLYSKGVPPEHLNSKVSWADAEMPQHLAIMTSSYLTNSARTWLEKTELQKAYRIHSIEGKTLKQLLLNFPELVSRYFVDEYSKLLQEAYSNWVVHNLLPNPGVLAAICSKIDVARFSIDELAFVCCAVHAQTHDISVRGFDTNAYSFDHLLDYLLEEVNSEQSVLSFCTGVRMTYWKFGSKNPDPKASGQDYLLSEIRTIIDNNYQRAIYCCVQLSEKEGIEILVSTDGTAKIHHIPSNIKEELQKKAGFFNRQP